MTDPSEYLNLISTSGSGGSFLDDIGINNMPSTSIPQGSASEQLFNMDSYQNFNNRPPGGGTPHQKLHHLDGQSQGEAFQPFSQKLSHYANPMLNQQNAFQGSATNKPQPQQFPRMPIRMHSPNQFNAQPSNSPGSPWRGQPDVNNSFGNYLPPQSQQQPAEQGIPARPMPQSYPSSMSQQQSNIQRLQHFMTNKQTNPMLGQSQNPFLSQAGSTLTDISNSTPKMNRDNKPALLSPNVQQQYATDMARQEQFSKLHHLSAGSVPSPSSDTSTNTVTSLAGFSASTNSTFTPSPDPFSSGKNPVAMFTNLQQQQQHSGLPNQPSIQSPDPFAQSTPAVSMPQDFLMRRQPQFSDGGGFPMRPAAPYQQQMMNPSPNQISGQLKSAHLLYQLQRLQQQISQVRELPSPNDQQLQQLQQQFGRLYHLYLMDQQQQKKQFQTGQLTYDQVGVLKQQQQEKANRIVAEAIAKSALTNNSFNFRMEAPMKYFNQQYGVGPSVKGPMNYDMKQLDKIAQRKAMEPIILPPSIVNQLPKTVIRGSSKPPATVLSKPVINRQRRDSSDHEPSPPTSPGSFFPDDYQPSSITRRSLRERKKKTYKDDFDYNLSEEEGDGEKGNNGSQNSDAGIPTDDQIPYQEETLTVEKILSLRIEPKEDGVATEEFLVKYKNYSYLHCEWATAEKLMRADKRVQMKIKRYFIKRSTMPFPDELDEEPFNPDYVENDRLLDVSTGVDQASGEPVTHYLVKWKSLPYDESTWEVEANVGDETVKTFRRNQMIPPPHERQFRRRPHPQEWRKLDQTPVFNNSNVLREYQLEGLNWLTFCWYNGQNCILADEMGLGKTIQSLTFLVHVMQYGIRGPFLVIAPLSTIANWQREFEAWTDVNVVVHHGSAASRHLIQQYEFYFRGNQGEPVIGMYKFHVLITTYEILIADNMLLSSIPWRVVVIDEAHRLKNRNCKLLEGLNNLQMEHRILLTGTPLQNNVDELFSLLNFLEPAQFPSQGAFLMEFGDLKTEAQVERLQALLRPMMLRRMKEDVEKSLAPKEETIVEVELTTVQKKFYRAILERNFTFLSKGAVSTSNVPNLMNTVMELRKCCNHPFLINGAEEKIVGEYVANVTVENKAAVHLNSLIEASGKLVLIDKLLPKLKIGGHKVLVFSQMVRCLDILEDYLICKKYPFERIDGRVRGNLRQAAIDRFSKPDSDRFVFLLCTRAGGLGINLTAADTVIIFDSDWNPQNDLQAQARCHRIGQAKSVKVYRLITRNSYEREMFDRASMKLGLDKAVLQSMNGKDKESSTAGGPNQALSKKEIEDLLRKGAYGAVMDDDESSSKFCEEDIDQILERRTQVITLDSVGQGSTFAKASFTATKKGDDIDIDDPDFWRKWAMKADIDVDELLNKDERIIDAPRQRKQTKRYGKEDDVDFELSDLDSDEETPQPKKRAWTRVECFKVEKNLLVFGWERWKDVIHSIRKRKLTEREVEAISRSILLFCVHAYRGDEKLRSFILELIKPAHSRERLPSEELDATYMPLQKGSGKKAKKASKKSKSGSKPVNKSAIALLEAIGDWKSINPELLILDEGYKKHLRHHCNKILLRVRLLYIMRCEVIGPMETAVRNDCQASTVNVNLPVTEGDPPNDWWDEDADKSLVIGVYKHGYERYNAIRADPCLCFLAKCGPPTSREDNPTGDPLFGEGREEDDNRDDPDYQLPTPQDRKIDEGMESDYEEDFDVERKDASNSFTEQKEVKKVEPPAPVMTPEIPSNPATTSNLLPWPTPSDLNTRLRRIVAGFQRILKREELKRVAVEKENKRKEKVEEAVRQKELKKAEQAQKWSKREEVDFYRCVSTYGVHINPTTGEYDWTKFRQMARLDKKNDARLSSYFRDFLAMCKRVCGRPDDDEAIHGQSAEPISEERASRCLRRVDLMDTLRREVLNHPELDERLNLAQLTPELPSWWQCKKHDKDLLLGVSKHGLTRTDLNILEDPELSFYELKSEMEAQHLAMTAGNPSDLTSASPESAPRSVNSTPTAFERPLDKTVLEKIDKLDNREGSLDNQSFPVVHTKIVSPTALTPPEAASFATSDGIPKNNQHPPSIYNKQNYMDRSMPALPGSDALSSLVKQVSALPANPDDPSDVPITPTAEKKPETNPRADNSPRAENNPAEFPEGDSHGLAEGASFNMNPVVNDSLAVKVWWPKDRVVFHRVQQLCHCVVNGEWPSKPERGADKNVDPSAAELSVSPGAFHAFAESEMDGGLGGEPVTDPASKAFKVKKHEGLKVTFKKNKKRKKKNGEGLDGNVPKESMIPTFQGDINFPFKMEPREMAGQSNSVEKPKKKRQRKEKSDKTPRTPSDKNKRGRKTKAPKSASTAGAGAAAAVNVIQPPSLSPQPGEESQEWTKGNNVNMYIAGGATRGLVNGPQDMPLVNDIDIRRASVDNAMDESYVSPIQSASEDQGEQNTFRTSVLRSTDNPERDFVGIKRRLSSSTRLPDKSLSFESANIVNPHAVSPATTPPVRVSPFSTNSTEFPFGNNPYMNYSNYSNTTIMGYPNPTISKSPGFAPGFPGPVSSKGSAASSPTSSTSTGSGGSTSHKSSNFIYDSSYSVANSQNNTPASNFGESLGFNGFSSGLGSTSMNYAKRLGLDDGDAQLFNPSDSENEPQSDEIEDSDDEAIPQDPIPS